MRFTVHRYALHTEVESFLRRTAKWALDLLGIMPILKFVSERILPLCAVCNKEPWLRYQIRGLCNTIRM